MYLSRIANYIQYDLSRHKYVKKYSNPEAHRHYIAALKIVERILKNLC